MDLAREPMIADPEARGHSLARFFCEVAPRLLASLEEAAVLPDRPDDGARRRVRSEWEHFALHACVRGLVAAGGFGQPTERAVEALHEAVLAAWVSDPESIEAPDARRARMAERYREYGEIGTAGGAAGAATVGARLAAAAGRHMAGDTPAQELVELLATLHEQLAEGAAEAVRRAE